MEKILSHHPKEYLEQGLTQCGAYSVKAILSAYGKDSKNDPRDYLPNFLAKYTGINLWPALWPKVLNSYGVPAERSSAKNLSDVQRLELLKKSIDDDKIVMLRIGNGFSKSGNYNAFVAFFMGHWITLWGYDNEKKIFYVYDSYVALSKHNKVIPIGNITRTFTEVIRDWGRGFPPVWHHSFIKVG